MYTIVMDKYKNLNTTVKTTIFQKENMVDKIQFLVPPIYEGNDLSEYIVSLKYLDPYGNFHSEVLNVDTELYKDYLRYELPVGSKLTQLSGEITLRLTFIKFIDGSRTSIAEHSVVDTRMVVTENPDPDPDVIDQMDTNSTTLTVTRPRGFSEYVVYEDIEAYKEQIERLSLEVSNMPQDLELNENDNLHLVHGDRQIGEGVEVLTWADQNVDEEDGE